MSVQPVDHPLAQRAAFCWRNDLENIPLFMILSLGYVLIGGGERWALVYFSVFTVARVLHTICYIFKAQPWRTMAYELGAVSTLALAIHTVYLAW